MRTKKLIRKESTCSHKSLITKLHQRRPQNGDKPCFHEVHAQYRVIGCPIPEKRNERKEGWQAPEPEPGTRKWSWNSQKTRETSPGTLPQTKRTEEMMMEQNARIPGTKKSWWNKTVSWKMKTTFSSRAVWATSPVTLAGTRNRWWNRVPEE